jgi:hypothetical protein
VTASFVEESLTRKLGLREQQSRLIINAPEDLVPALTSGAAWCATAADVPEHMGGFGRIDHVQYFVRDLATLKAKLPLLKALTHSDGALWICFPRVDYGEVVDLDESIIRRLAIEHSMVDSQTWTLSREWMALKLIVPLAMRPRTPAAKMGSD